MGCDCPVSSLLRHLENPQVVSISAVLELRVTNVVFDKAVPASVKCVVFGVLEDVFDSGLVRFARRW